MELGLDEPMLPGRLQLFQAAQMPNSRKRLPLANLPDEELKKLLIGQTRLPNNAFDDMLWQFESFMIGK